VSPAELEPLAVLAAGTVFNGRYEIVRAIRIGGMGAVYEVIHLETRRRSALKVMLPSFTRDPELRARFRREATVVADVQSEHLAEVFDAGVDRHRRIQPDHEPTRRPIRLSTSTSWRASKLLLNR
jgi:serine/threonine protein kinase